MKNKDFDNWIQNKVAEYEKLSIQGNLQDAAKPDWHEMSRRMNLEETNMIFDSQIKSTLQQAEVLSSEANWQNFQRKLELLRERRNRILSARLAELVLVLFIFWTIQAVVEQEVINIKVNPTVQSTLTQASKRDVFMFGENQTQGIVEMTTIANIPKNLLLLTKDRLKQKNSKSRSENLKTYSSSTSLNNTPHTYAAQTSVPMNISVSEKAEEIKGIVKDESRDVIQFNPDPTTQVQIKVSTVTSSEKDQPSNLFKQIFPLQTREDSDKVENDASQVSSKIIPETKVIAKRNIWLGTSLSVNEYSIQSTKSVPDYINRNTIKASSFSKNLRVILDYPKWMIEVGADFSTLGYEPGKYLNFSRFAEGVNIDIIKKITFQLVELPFTLQYKLLQSPRLSLMLVSGMNLAICNTAKYKKISAISPPKVNSLYFNPNEYTEPILVEYNHGISIDNRAKGNSYANALVGLKFNYKILDYFILSSDVQYKSMLGSYGFGPIDQKFKSLHFSLGMYYSLN